MRTTSYTREQIEKATEDGFGMAAEHAGVPTDNPDFNRTLTTFWAYFTATDTYTPERTHAREHVTQLLNRATDDAAHPGCADDIDNFAVNATLTLLDDPDATITDVATECYGEDAATVTGWLRAAT
ncbi:hypothetical protein ACFWRZ_34660 [Streptomyces rubiginosohelvolus]|uniref:hypothetical protein n=1 Tax=Streptomyces rubiginosohelvolus TaxID=67362 RepID=UPI0036605052